MPATVIGRPVLSASQELLWVGPGPLPANVRSAAEGRWRIAMARPEEPLGPQMATYSARRKESEMSLSACTAMAVPGWQ